MNAWQRAAFWGLVGLIVATPLDALHVATGVLSYTTPRSWMPFGLQDWFVFPLFTGSGLALGLGHRHIATRLAGNPLPPASGSAAALGLVALVVSYASSGFLQAWPWVALVLYAAMFFAAIACVAPVARTALVLHAVGAGFFGPLVEVTLSRAGLFHYHHPDFLGVALWLPGIYWNAGTASHLLDRWLLGRAARSP